MRIAPRTMLISTTLFVGSDADIDERYREFRDLTTQTGDLTSLAIATAGRIISFAVNDNRVPEAAALASELEDMVSHIDCDAETREHHPQCGGMCTIRQLRIRCRAQRSSMRSRHYPRTNRQTNLSRQTRIRGAIEMCAGDYEEGRRHLREGLEHARALPPVSYATNSDLLRALTTALGMDQADDLVDDVREALRRAESFGDISGIIDRAVRLRHSVAARRGCVARRGDRRASTRPTRTCGSTRVLTIALPAIGADLAIDAARHGRSDEAIDELRAPFAFHMDGGSRVFVGCAGEALVGLLIDRGSTDDLAEAHRIVDRVAGPSARHSRAGPVVAEVAGAVGQGGGRLGRVRRARHAVPRALREARRPRATR